MFINIIQTFKKKNITVIPVETAKEARDQILKMIPKKSTVGYGGSITLEDMGILKAIQQGDYELLDWSTATRNAKKDINMRRRALQADFFLSSSNAITEDGKIVNIDGTGNRVASLIFGPKRVIIVVGKNKIVKNYGAAIARIKTVAAPLNAKRLNKNTPCVKTGKCLLHGSSDCICHITAIIDGQSKPDRITIILVNEELGY